MSYIDRITAPGEHVVYRARFGSARLVYELIIVCLGLAVGSLLGPGIVIVLLLLIAWLWDERRLQEVAVTSNRLVHKRHSGSSHLREINLDKIESIRKSGGKIIVSGTGGTKIKLPDFLADEAQLRAALLNGGTMPEESQQTLASTSSKPPIWKRPLPITLFIVFIVLPATGALVREPEQDVRRAPQPQKITDVQSTASPSPARPLPKEVQSIEETDVMGNAKRSVVVRLTTPVSEETLETIARAIQAQKPHVDRTFIEYLIGDMAYGTGAWATTHFNPDLEVQVLGPTVEQLMTSKEDAKNEVVGRWIGQMGAILTITHDAEGVVLVRSYSDGSRGQDRLSKSETPHGVRYDPAEDTSGTGDHYILRRDGSLESRDNLGLIFVAPPSP